MKTDSILNTTECPTDQEADQDGLAESLKPYFEELGITKGSLDDGRYVYVGMLVRIGREYVDHAGNLLYKTPNGHYYREIDKENVERYLGKAYVGYILENLNHKPSDPSEPKHPHSTDYVWNAVATIRSLENLVRAISTAYLVVASFKLKPPSLQEADNSLSWHGQTVSFS